MTVDWRFVAVALFFVAGGGVAGWYIAMKRKTVAASDSPSLMMRATSALLILFAIGSVGQIFYFQREQAQQSDRLTTATDCQYRINRALIDALTARQDPSKDKDDALQKTIQTVITAKSDNEIKLALQDYIDTSNRLNAARAANPYPTIPNDCRASK